MLVLTRMMGDEIVIGDPGAPVAVVRIVEVHGGKVRVGVTAPESVPVHRAEVARRIALGAALPDAIAAAKGERP